MNLSIYLAELWGIVIVVVSIAFLAKPKRIERLLDEMKNEATMFLWGMVSLIIGIAMVLAHNIWVLDWRVVITLLGWSSLIKGLDVMFFPDRMRKRWAAMKGWQWQPLFIMLLVIGLAIAYLGFTA